MYIHILPILTKSSNKDMNRTRNTFLRKVAVTGRLSAPIVADILYVNSPDTGWDRLKLAVAKESNPQERIGQVGREERERMHAAWNFKEEVMVQLRGNSRVNRQQTWRNCSGFQRSGTEVLSC